MAEVAAIPISALLMILEITAYLRFQGRLIHHEFIQTVGKKTGVAIAAVPGFSIGPAELDFAFGGA